MGNLMNEKMVDKSTLRVQREDTMTIKTIIKKSIFGWILLSGITMANSLPKHYTKTLGNGMQVVVIPMDNDSGVITTDIYYKVGSRNEVMGKSGMAHMLEHLSFKSTKKLKEGNSMLSSKVTAA